jgi:hypothetical protein
MPNLRELSSAELFILGRFVDVAEKIIKGAVYFNIDVDGDMNGFDLDRLDIHFVLGTGGTEAEKQGQTYKPRQ